MSKLNSCKTILFMCVFCALGAVASPAQTFKTILSFDGADGGGPSGLVQGLDGNFYGTADGGGYGYGTVFRETPGGQPTTIYSFEGPDGISPLGLILATDGNFYGTTFLGGSNTCPISGYGCGTIFKISPEGKLASLYRFCARTNCTDGTEPQAALVQGTDGNFYGTTSEGGSNCAPYGCGTVFKITSGGKLTTLYSFCAQTNCTDGSDPLAALIQATNGNFYGTTYMGGAYGGGTVFEITPEGKLTTLYSFCAQGAPYCPDGYGPSAGLVQATNGSFYGTTYQGGAVPSGGTVFEITANGKLTTLHSFDFADGADPVAGLIQGTDGNLYGTTFEGDVNEAGTIFKITPEAKLTTLHDFCLQSGCPDGLFPRAPLVQGTNGILYGTTYNGGGSGCDSGCGTIFSLSLGLAPFVKILPVSGGVGEAVIILGNGLTKTREVNFHGVAATFKVASDTEIETTVPPEATTGPVQVTTSGGTLKSNVLFQVTAQQALPIASIAPASLMFGAQDVGTSSTPQTFTLSDTGNAPLTVTGIMASDNFDQTNNCGTSITPSSPCTINVTFSPAASGRLTGNVTEADDSKGTTNSMQKVSVSGTGAASVVGISPSRLTFGAQREGTTSAVQTIILRNTGNAPLKINSIVTSANFRETNNCRGSVAAGGACTIGVTFTPIAGGPLTGTLAITDNNEGAAGSTQTVGLSGTGE